MCQQIIPPLLFCRRGCRCAIEPCSSSCASTPRRIFLRATAQVNSYVQSRRWLNTWLPDSNGLRVEFCTFAGRSLRHRGDTAAIMSFVEFNAFAICRELWQWLNWAITPDERLRDCIFLLVIHLYLYINININICTLFYVRQNLRGIIEFCIPIKTWTNQTSRRWRKKKANKKKTKN